MSGKGKDKIWILVGIGAVGLALGILFSIRNRRRIVLFSEALVGQTEISGNAGFTNQEFQKLIKEVGWSPGDAWCVYFAKLVWYNMAPDWLKAKILRRVTGNTFATWDNLRNDKSFIVSAIPRAGDLVIWQKYSNGQPTSDGHAGIVKSLNLGNFTTIEGNTNDLGGSEGYIVAEKTRAIDFSNKNGLRILGFIRFA
jgi:hypothetical protein